MTPIVKIILNVQTGNLSGAGTDGDVYLGICGREFYVDTTRDDFERGSTRTYILGDSANVNFSSLNDPRKQRLAIEDVDGLPVYLRFQPSSRSDNWQLQRAVVTLNEFIFPMWDTSSYVLNDPREGIWLGIHFGLVAHIPKHVDPGVK